MTKKISSKTAKIISWILVRKSEFIWKVCVLFIVLQLLGGIQIGHINFKGFPEEVMKVYYSKWSICYSLFSNNLPFFITSILITVFFYLPLFIASIFFMRVLLTFHLFITSILFMCVLLPSIYSLLLFYSLWSFYLPFIHYLYFIHVFSFIFIYSLLLF